MPREAAERRRGFGEAEQAMEERARARIITGWDMKKAEIQYYKKHRR